MNEPTAPGPPVMPASGPSRDRLRRLFEAALEQAPEQRERWLEAYVPDPHERERIERWLIADAEAGALDVSLDQRLAHLGTVPELQPDGFIGKSIGAFRLTRLLGQGGMATVFLGERTDADFRQQVAIKMLRRGLYTELEQRLFRRERQTLAMLAHPNIAHLLDGGVTDAGIPYLVLEYVDGVPITEHAAREALGIEARLRLFATVCRAVAAAHRQLVVHRDLKPGNILVDADGTVKLLDFGVAKLLEEGAEEVTRTGLSALTPGYAAPEQFTGVAISTATDVYALGVLLHELLLGERPSGGPSAKASSRAAATRRPGPAGNRTPLPAPSAALAAALRGDLDNILMKAMAEEPGRRYASAGELADDIERHLRQEPVGAHPPSRWYRTRKFVQRHRGGVAASALLSVALLSSLALALWQAERAQRQAQVARSEALRANTVRDFVEALFRPVSQGVAEDRLPSVVELVEGGVETLHADARLGPAERVDLLMMFARLHDNLGRQERGRELGIAADELATRSLEPMHPAAVGALALRGTQAVRSFDHAAGTEPLHEALRRARLIDDPVAIAALDNLAVVEMDRGNREQALALEREALDLRIRHYGADDGRTAAGYNNLGYGLTGLGRFEEAAEAYRRTYEIDSRHRPAASYDVLGSLSNWGWALSQAGHVRRGKHLLGEAGRGLDALGGQPRFMHALNSQKLCGLELEFGDQVTAERACERMLEVVRAQAGASSFMMGLAWRLEAQRRIEVGDLAGAGVALDTAWELHPDAPEHQRARAGVLQARATLLWLRGDAVGAREQALVAWPLVAGKTPAVNLLRLRALLLQSCQAAPSLNCSATLADELTEAADGVPNQGDPRLLPARLALARAALLAGDADGARTLLDAAVKAASAELDPSHPQLLAAQYWLALSQAQAGDCATAVRAQDAAWKRAGKAARQDSPWLAEAREAWQEAGACSPRSS